MTSPHYNPTPFGSTQVVARKNRFVAAIFAFFLGIFGVHNFYLKKTGRGVAQLLLTVLSFGILSPIVGIWALIEAVLILFATPGSYPWGCDGRGTPLE